MGARGPKPGFKQQRAAQAAAAQAVAPETAAALQPAAAAPIPDAQPVVQPPAPPAEVKAVLSAADRENPNKLSGQDLRDLAHRRGIAKSLLPSMSDEKIRTELRYATYRQYEGENAVA